MIRLIIVLTGLTVFAGCSSQQNVAKSDTNCISTKIEEISSQHVWDPPAKIYSYQYNGQLVYHVPAKCCDIPSTVYDVNCNAVCSPEGGITGKGDGKCNDFFKKRTDEKLVWEDKRTP